jgi:opacity protein-like surface antigen
MAVQPRKDSPLNKTFKTAALAVAFFGIASAAYAADVVVQFDPSTVQYGYNDGYWSRTHEWHTWEKPEYVQTYRSSPNAAYYEYKHDRDPDMGWRTH